MPLQDILIFQEKENSARTLINLLEDEEFYRNLFLLEEADLYQALISDAETEIDSIEFNELLESFPQKHVTFCTPIVTQFILPKEEEDDSPLIPFIDIK